MARKWIVNASPVRGTLGVVLLAKQEGIISEVASAFTDLMRAGLRMDAAVLDKALRLAGER